MIITYPIIRINLNNTSMEFRDLDVIECEVVQETNLISEELPGSAVTAKIYTTDQRFHPWSDGEFYDALMQNLPIEVSEWVDDEEFYIGKFYLNKWYAPTEDTLVFEALDAVSVYSKISYDGSFWENNTRLDVLIPAILDSAGINYFIHPSVAGRTLKGWIWPGTIKDALQQVCFAARCMVTTSKSDGVNIYDAALPVPMVKRPFGYLGEFILGTGIYLNSIAVKEDITDADKTMQQELKILPMVTQVTVLSHDYSHPAEGQQAVETIFSGHLEPGNIKIPYEKPYWKVWADGVGALPLYRVGEDGSFTVTEDSGSTWETMIVITDSGTFNFESNCVYLTVENAGDVKVYGYPWLDNVQSFTYSEAAAQRTLIQGFYLGDGTLLGEKYLSRTTVLSATPNVLSVEKATLISSNNAAYVLKKISDYYKLRHEQTINLFPMPAADLGDLRIVDSLHEKKIVGGIERLVSNLSGGYLIETKLVGTERMEA